MRATMSAAIFGAMMLAGCAGSVPAAEVEPPPAPKLSGAETVGEKVMLASGYCNDYARRLCPAQTIACEAYRREFYKGCLIRVGVPADYVTALTSN